MRAIRPAERIADRCAHVGRAKLRQHDACGNALSLGEVVVTDWLWSSDIAKGKGCVPLPASNLPKGQILKSVN